jgi:hypothetical protein
MKTIELRSPDFSDGEPIPHRHSRDGENISPSLEWVSVPVEAAELLLLCEDPDAPRGTFLHWLVTDIDSHSAGVAERRIPEGGREWPNDFGETGWGGPAPPHGDKPHRYVFRLYALSEHLEPGANPTAEDVHRAADPLAVGLGTLIGTFQR